MAEDYFTAMQRVEERLDASASLSAGTIPPRQEEIATEIMLRSEYERALALVEELALPALSLEGRLAIAQRLRELFGAEKEHSPPEGSKELLRCELC